MSTDVSASESARLIDEFGGPRSPRLCMRCAAVRSARELDRFRYLDQDDESDRPRAVVLCEGCASALAGTDIRFEAQLLPLVDNKPYPGTLEVCLGCEYRDGLDCRSPLAALNGGPGIQFPDVTGTSVWVEIPGPLRQRIRVLRETWSKATKCTGRRVGR